jgi:hypothetical protein
MYWQSLWVFAPRLVYRPRAFLWVLSGPAYQLLLKEAGKPCCGCEACTSLTIAAGCTGKKDQGVLIPRLQRRNQKGPHWRDPTGQNLFGMKFLLRQERG